MKEHDIQIEALELKNKNDKIVVFAWELKGHRSTIRGKQANYAFYWSPIWLLLCPGRTKKHMRGSSTYTMLMSWRQWPHQSISWLQRWTGTLLAIVVASKTIDTSNSRRQSWGLTKHFGNTATSMK